MNETQSSVEDMSKEEMIEGLRKKKDELAAEIGNLERAKRGPEDEEKIGLLANELRKVAEEMEFLENH